MPLLDITHGLIRVSSLYASTQSARVRVEKVGTERRKDYGRKLFYHEVRPALERNIIDTSPSGASNRLICEDGRHFAAPVYTSEPGELADIS
jgi:hypothetical protein